MTRLNVLTIQQYIFIKTNTYTMTDRINYKKALRIKKSNQVDLLKREKQDSQRATLRQKKFIKKSYPLLNCEELSLMEASLLIQDLINKNRV